jgi:hypothetical protein
MGNNSLNQVLWSRDLASRHRTTHRGMGWDPGKRLTVRRVDKLIGIRAGGGISRGLDELAGRHRVGSNGVGAGPKRIGCAGCCRCPANELRTEPQRGPFSGAVSDGRCETRRTF